jgi:oxygen-independent coproporphyrinogen-3 oxidase
MPSGIGVYIHIPFCRTICPYCDFVKVRTPGQAPSAYTDALCREIAESPIAGRAIGSVFFGGGTPSLLAPRDLARVLEALRARGDMTGAEITLEANPDDVTDELARAWTDAGVNRVSLGVQSFDDRVLRYLGRRHDADNAQRACETVAAHLENWNLDLIFGAPPVEAWRNTLDAARALDPPHIACYGLTYEAGTPFGRRAHEAVDDDTSLAMYREAEERLHGYVHYEISNFAQPGREALHNLVYWNNGEYAGFGCAAYAYLGGVRARNLTDPAAYMAQPGVKCESEVLTVAEQQVETVIQFLRLRDGLPREVYARRFGHAVDEDFGEAIAALITRGLLHDEGAHLRPTGTGFYLNNEIGLALV